MRESTRNANFCLRPEKRGRSAMLLAFRLCRGSLDWWGDQESTRRRSGNLHSLCSAPGGQRVDDSGRKTTTAREGDSSLRPTFPPRLLTLGTRIVPASEVGRYPDIPRYLSIGGRAGGSGQKIVAVPPGPTCGVAASSFRFSLSHFFCATRPAGIFLEDGYQELLRAIISPTKSLRPHRP